MILDLLFIANNLKKRNFFISALTSAFWPAASQPDTSLHFQTTGPPIAHLEVWMFALQLSLVLTAPTHRWMARPS